MKYLSNSFSPSMVSLPSLVRFSEVSLNEFCEAVKDPVTINSIGHQSTIDIINILCQSNLKMNRIMIKTQPGDTIYIFLLTERLEEGKVLDAQELSQLVQQGKVKFIRAVIYRDIIDDLKACKGICNEKEYDAVVSNYLG